VNRERFTVNGERSTTARYRFVAAVLAVAVACGPSTASLPSVAGVKATVDTSYYDAEGVTRRQWLASMRASAQRAGIRVPFLAHTSWQTRWSYATSRSTSMGCEARLPGVEVMIRYTMPRLVSDSGVAPEDVLEWRRHMTSLWRHEEGHAIRAMRAATEMRDSLAHFRAPSCGALQSAVSRTMDAIVQKYRGLQDAYDARSGHGARQGAILLLPGMARLTVDTTFRDTVPE
jgi:predicted secreted Zn-dependent protease